MAIDPHEVLKRIFGFESFRGRQAEVIEHIIDGGDCLVLMPTGGGKSLCFQIPALCRNGVAIVVSPLIALMEDQVAALKQNGVSAEALHSGLPAGAWSKIDERLHLGDLDLLYVSPERLMMNGFLDRLDSFPLALFAIDEAHCVSQWGHDFRPEYRQLSLLAERFPGVPRVALTATADIPTRNDIVERLRLPADSIFAAGFDRPNIFYRVTPKNNPRDQLLNFLNTEHGGDAGIVYCQTRKRTDEMATWLSAQGWRALPYHAGLDSSIRAEHQERFLKEEGVVMVATIAFGMGIDKPNVRFVVHMDLPKSLESYYQETGRAGRDELPANAWMAYGMQDVARISQFITNSEADVNQKLLERRKLDSLVGFCETAACRRQVLLGYFGETLVEPCGNCDTCLDLAETFDCTEAVQKALSCVYRTGEIFGAAHVTDVLLGGDTEKVRRFHHNGLSTYGVGEGTSRAEWQSIFRQLVAMGLLVVDVEGHGGLRLGPDCRPVLRGERRVELRRETIQNSSKKGSKPSGGTAARASLSNPGDEALFQELRQCRMQLARAQGVPPYVIFNDRTLLEIAQVRPRHAYEMALLNGIGEVKLQRYGDEFLAVVDAHDG